jgi:PAS domain S-box-containing protein
MQTTDRTTENSADEEELRQKLRQLQVVANATPVLVAYFDASERYIFVNEAYAEWRDRTPEEIVGRQLAEVVDEATYTALAPHIQVVLSGRTANFEINIARADRPARYFSASLVPDIRAPEGVRALEGADDGGRTVGFVATIVDITENKAVEADLRAKERELRDFLENSVVGLHWVGPDGTILWANQAELDMLGYTREEYIGRNIAEFHADPETIEDILNRLRAKETLHSYEARMVAADGSDRHVLISSNVLWDENGRFVHTRCFTRDITGRKSAEVALRESEERNRALLEQVSEAIFLLEPESKRFILANPAFQQLVGYTVEDLAEMTIYDVLPYERERIDRAVQRALTEGDYKVSDRLYRRKDGTHVNVEVGITPVYYMGTLVLCEIVRDITERKYAEEERNRLLHSEQTARAATESALRIRDELLAVVSHDLKNPLAAIKGNVQLLKRRIELASVPEGERFLDVLGRIDQAQEKMNSLINELMDFGHLQTGLPLSLQLRPTGLVALVRRVAADHEHIASRHALSVEAPPAEIVGRWDAARLERVFANILSNAIKYSPHGGEITITISKEEGGKWAAVSLRDQGLGIAPEDLPHIFEWFRRASSVSGRIGGAGIGLASSMHTIRNHGGIIEVESEPGQGSCFTVRLPVEV